MSIPTSEENKAVVRKYFDNYWTRINVDIVDETCHPDYQLTYPLCGVVKGRQNAKDLLKGLQLSFPDVSFRPVGPLIAENTPDGQYVVGRFEGGGTHTGPPITLAIGSLKEANTGKVMSITGTAVYRLENGLIVEEIGEEGAIDAIKQFGLYIID